MPTRDTLPAPPPDTMTNSEMTRADLLNLQDKWLRARDCLVRAEKVLSERAAQYGREGRYNEAQLCRDHAHVMKGIRLGMRAEELFTL